MKTLKKSKLKRRVALLSVTVLTIMSITGCGKSVQDVFDKVKGIKESVQTASSDSEKNLSDYEMTSTTVGELKKKYGKEDLSIRPFYNVEQTTEFTFPFKSKVEPCKAVTVHTDPKCELSSTVYQINDAYDNGTGYDIVVKPGMPVLNENGRKLDNYNWGYAPVYYLCIRYDMYSPVPTELETPIIVPFTIKSEISVPNLTCRVNSDGSFALDWKPVDGAVGYNIYEAYEATDISEASKMTRAECCYIGDHLNKVASVDASVTSFTDLRGDGTDNTMKDGDGYISSQNSYSLGSYYVTAVDVNGNESLFSMAVEGWKYSSQLPYYFDKFKDFKKDDMGHITQFADTANVQMRDKSFAQFPINFKKISEDDYCATYEYYIPGTKLTGTMDYYNENKEYPEEVSSTKNFDYAMYNIQNNINIIPDNQTTTMGDGKYVDLGVKPQRDESKKISYSRDALLIRADLESARIPMNGIYPEGKGPFDMASVDPLESVENIATAEADSKQPESITQPNSRKYFEEEKEASDESDVSVENFVEKQITSSRENVKKAEDQVITVPAVKLFADSAEEEYLAGNLVACNEKIDLSGFPKLQNAEYLLDCLYKVVFQNPYVESVQGFAYDPNSSCLNIQYGLDAATVAAHQSKLTAEADRIISETITTGMSSEEKVNSIWDYLEENTTYDMDACKAAETSSFTDVTGHEDAFNAYGIMCKKKGVCQSYALTCKLLFSMCDVPCNVVTGYLNKDLPHAWNAVELDGKWYMLDATNNANASGIPYLLYQSSSDFAVLAGYTGDDRYELNDNLLYLANSDASKDYYSETGLYAESLQDIIRIVSDQYDQTGDYIYVKCNGIPDLDNEKFVNSLFQALREKEHDPNRLLNAKAGYASGFFVFAKGE